MIASNGMTFADIDRPLVGNPSCITQSTIPEARRVDVTDRHHLPYIDQPLSPFSGLRPTSPAGLAPGVLRAPTRSSTATIFPGRSPSADPFIDRHALVLAHTVNDRFVRLRTDR
jgi:hypothetical protein